MIYKESHSCHTKAERDKPEKLLEALEHVFSSCSPYTDVTWSCQIKQGIGILAGIRSYHSILEMAGAEGSPERKRLKEQLPFC